MLSVFYRPHLNLGSQNPIVSSKTSITNVFKLKLWISSVQRSLRSCSLDEGEEGENEGEDDN